MARRNLARFCHFGAFALWLASLTACSPRGFSAAGEDLGEFSGETKLVSTRSAASMELSKSEFGKTPDGKTATLYTCRNNNGLVLKLTDYGAIMVAIEVPDRDGKLANVTLGFDKLDGYLLRHPYYGSTVGRFCNRIARGKFELNGKEYTLEKNNGENHLHGGLVGFDKVLWKAETLSSPDTVGVKFTHRSPDGDEGYPGNLDVEVTYILSDKGELRIEFNATTDKATPINLTNHAYWNLSGAKPGSNILDHQLMLAADSYIPVDDTLIPTGKIDSVENTPLDFRTAHAIGAHLDEIKADPKGYDHCYVLRSQSGALARAAQVHDPKSGRSMEVFTTQPGIQLYTGNFLAGKESDGGFNQYEGFCLETQHYPDSPNQPNFPSAILKPGEKFHQITTFRFWAK